MIPWCGFVLVEEKASETMKGNHLTERVDLF
jgi:hypothetical protein